MSVATSQDRYKWKLLVLLCFAFFLHQANRVLMGVVLPAIGKDLRLTGGQVGLLGTSLFVTLAFMTPVAGYVGDVLNKKWVITFSMIFCSAATLLAGFAGGAGMLLFRSVAIACGESFYAPAAYPLIASFHSRTRTIALSVHQTSLYLAMMVTGILAGWVAERWGWRSAFFLCGGGGILLGGVLALKLRGAPSESSEPREGPKSSVTPREAFGSILRTPTALLIVVSFTAAVLQYNAYVVWAPSFLKEKFGLSMAQAGGLSMFCLYLAEVAGVLTGGMLSDRIVVTRPSFRLQLQSAAMFFCAPAILIMALADNLALTCGGMVALGLFQGMYQSNTPASLFDVIRPRYRSSALGFMMLFAYLVGSVSPWLLGHLRETFGNVKGLSYGFAALSGTYVIGALTMLAACVFTFRRDRHVELSAAS